MTGGRVLIVEDEIIVAMDLKHRLAERGYEVTGIVSDAEQALQSVTDREPDVVLMDIMLQGTSDGIDAARRIREVSSVPIVYLTAYADDLTIARARNTDASGYVIKPFRDRELHAALQMAMGYQCSEFAGERLLRRLARSLSGLRGTTISVGADGTVSWGEEKNTRHESGVPQAPLQVLTRRERGVARAVLAGHGIAEAAVMLGISRHTVRNHLKAIFRKLGVHSQLELVRRYRDSIVPDEESSSKSAG